MCIGLEWMDAVVVSIIGVVVDMQCTHATANDMFCVFNIDIICESIYMTLRITFANH